MQIVNGQGTVLWEDTSVETLGGANLQNANLRDANLRGADLRCANLQNANLRGANLGDADLRCANLWGANLWGADLGGADLWGANLQNANLRGANLGDADLGCADLGGANLQNANLRDANLAPVVAAQLSIVPDGELHVWKAARRIGTGEPVLVGLLIPAGVARSNATGRRCRAAEAVVTSVETIDGQPVEPGARSVFDSSFVYLLNATVTPSEPFNTDRWIECASGIHFYLTRAEAEAEAMR